MDHKKINIAIFVNTVLKVGGGFTYVNNIIEQLLSWEQSEFNFLFYSDKHETIEYLKTRDIESILVFSGYKNIFRTLVRDRKICIGKKISDLMKKDNIDLAYLPGPFSTWLELEDTRFIFTIHDLGHRDIPVFPEVYNHGEFERREKVYGQGAVKSFATIVDSEITKNKLLDFYGVNNDKVEILEFLPNMELSKIDASLGKSILDRFNISKDFIFYPAQFWAHKNHNYILEGVKLYNEKYNKKLNVVFSGANHGNLSYVLNKAKELEIDNQVYYVGFISNEEMAFLYKNCLALVMPTYLSNTNIPPLEAFMMKVPVLYPNYLECADILKHATINIDLADPNSFVSAIQKVIDNDEEVNDKVEQGYEYITKLQNSNYMEPIVKILNRYKHMRQAWN